MRDRALRGITQECSRDRGPSLLIPFAPLDLRGLAFCSVGAFELVVPGGLSEQLLNVWRQSESEVAAEVTTSDLAREPIARRPIRRLAQGAAGYLPRSDGLSVER